MEEPRVEYMGCVVLKDGESSPWPSLVGIAPPPKRVAKPLLCSRVGHPFRSIPFRALGADDIDCHAQNILHRLFVAYTSIIKKRLQQPLDARSFLRSFQSASFERFRRVHHPKISHQRRIFRVQNDIHQPVERKFNFWQSVRPFVNVRQQSDRFLFRQRVWRGQLRDGHRKKFRERLLEFRVVQKRDSLQRDV